MNPSYEDRLNVPLGDSPSIVIFTKDHLVLSVGYTRIVIGKRGPYIECSNKQIVIASIHIPEEEKHRIDNDTYYYNEYRSKDVCNVKLYFQKKIVDYADYVKDMWYISPFDVIALVPDKGLVRDLVTPLHPSTKEASLFD